MISLSYEAPGKESATPRERPKAYAITKRVRIGAGQGKKGKTILFQLCL